MGHVPGIQNENKLIYTNILDFYISFDELKIENVCGNVKLPGDVSTVVGSLSKIKQKKSAKISVISLGILNRNINK